MPGFEIFGEEEKKEVQDVLNNGVLLRYNFEAMRKGVFKAKTFEEELAKKINVKYAHLCASGTVAVSTALAVCGVGAGDEVIVSPFTFIATIEAVLSLGAVPIFADIDATLCLDPVEVEKKITKRTKAVLPVHMCGSMAHIDKLQKLCNEKGIILVEDACQALGGTFNGKALGSFGKTGAFSFDFVKTITCGEGGAVITSDEKIYNFIHQYCDHGHDHIGTDRGAEGHPILGTNYRISELNAAVGLAQVRKLEKILQIQRENKKLIKDEMKKLKGVSFREVPDEKGDSATFLSFFMKDENTTRNTVKELAKIGVDGCFYYYDNNWHYLKKWEQFQNLKSVGLLPLKLYATCPDYTKIDISKSDEFIKRNISMQIKLSWTKKDIEERIKKICSVISK